MDTIFEGLEHKRSIKHFPFVLNLIIGKWLQSVLSSKSVLLRNMVMDCVKSVGLIMRLLNKI